MAGKKKTIQREDYGTPPATLEGHPFYGLQLDDDQKAFRDAIWNPNNDIIFCDASAGVGKTTIALGTANLLVQYGLYDHIIYMMAPTQEARTGYLPGDVSEKMSPYFLPLYDAAITLGLNPFNDINECSTDWQQGGGGYIDCMTNLYLRGRNIDSKTILLTDESQNAYKDEMKTILTRVHDGTKCIIIGHSGQCDLYKNPERSGFVPYMEHFKGQDRCQICELHNNHRGWISRHADLL